MCVCVCVCVCLNVMPSMVGPPVNPRSPKWDCKWPRVRAVEGQQACAWKHTASLGSRPKVCLLSATVCPGHGPLGQPCPQQAPRWTQNLAQK